MRCPECQFENSDLAHHCGNCGYILKETEEDKLAHKDIPSHLGIAVIATFLGSYIFGFIAILYASKVGGKVRNKDYVSAIHCSQRAKIWSLISFGFIIAAVIIAFIVVMVTNN